LNSGQYISPELVGANQRNTVNLLRQAKNITRIREIVNDSHALSENLIEKEQATSTLSLDCKAGCSFCCYNQVGVTPAEVLVISDYLKTRLNKDELKALNGRITDLDKVTHNLNFFDRKKSKLPCPLLVNNQCSVYEVRPLSCRGWNSTDVNDCQRALETREDVEIKVSGNHLMITNSISTGITRGLLEAGLRAAPLELTAALRIVLSKFNAAEKYLAGQNVFGDARLNEIEAASSGVIPANG
jgi:Fe-S-cluster containining protein